MVDTSTDEDAENFWRAFVGLHPNDSTRSKISAEAAKNQIPSQFYKSFYKVFNEGGKGEDGVYYTALKTQGIDALVYSPGVITIREEQG